MSNHCSSLLAQVSFAERVIVFIHELFCKVIQGQAHQTATSEICRRFHLQIDECADEFYRLGTNEHDCRRAAGKIAYDEVIDLCGLVKDGCEYAGFKGVADRYLNPLRLMRLVYRMDEAKLAALNEVIHGECNDVGEVMMRVGAILDDDPNRYAELDDAAKRKAKKDVEKIAATVETIASGVDSLHEKMDAHNDETEKQFTAVREELHETKEELLARADEMMKKIGNVNLGGKRNGAHSIEQKKVCLTCWMLAQRNVELKSGTKKGIATYAAAFNWYKRQLALVNVTTPQKFAKVINTIKVKKCVDQKAALYAKQEAARKAAKKSGVQASKRR